MEIKTAVNKAVKNKATSWDLIPGKAIKDFFKMLGKDKFNEVCNKLKEILNNYITYQRIPEEITTSRLFCLNKNASEAGDINNIRPIAIASTFIKIIESIILRRLLEEINNKKILCKKQTGFIKNCGTELNLIKLRQKISDIKKLKNSWTKYLIFIDLKNAYDKVIHEKLFKKLEKQGISKDIIGTIKLLYSKAKLKVSNDSNYINVNNGVLQGSLISPILFNLYINDLIIELDNSAFEVLAYADDLCVICENRNELIRVIKNIDKWCNNNGISVNKKKSGIMIIKGKKEFSEFGGYPIIEQYKYLGVLIDKNMSIEKHIKMINDRIDIYFQKNYVLNKRYFSVKSIILLFGYFQKARLLYGLPAFIDKKTSINRVEKIMLRNIKKLLKFPIKTSNLKLKVALGLTNLDTYLICRLLKVKEKYECYFNEKLTMYDKVIKKILYVDYIPKSDDTNNFLINNLKQLADELNIKIGEKFHKRLKEIIYNWYVDSDSILLRFIVCRGYFRQDLYSTCILCKKENNSIEHVINSCIILNNSRNELLKKINKSNIQSNLLETIKYIYFTKEANNKQAIKEDRKDIRLIKEFLYNMYKTYGIYIRKDNKNKNINGHINKGK